MTPPPVILLDIDGTLIGDITPQVVLYDLMNRIKQTKGLKSSKPQMSVKDLQDKLREGIVRPYFKTFIHEMYSHGVEVFIYTASEKKWAEFLIKNIEVAYNIKFNRPLFTRNNCKLEHGEYLKNVTTVLPQITKCLNKKYNAHFKPNDIRNNVMLVDNNNVYVKTDTDKLVLCTTYKYSCPENICAYFNRSNYDMFSSHIHETLVSHIPGYKPYKNFMRFERQFYQAYVDALHKTISNKEACASDMLFKTLTWCIVSKNIKAFTKNNIKYINWKINGK